MLSFFMSVTISQNIPIFLSAITINRNTASINYTHLHINNSFLKRIYISAEDIDKYNPLPVIKFLFLAAKPYLDRINNIHALEKSLYSDYLGLAGRVDCIAEYEGELAVIDFKTSKKIKPEEWIENYHLPHVDRGQKIVPFRPAVPFSLTDRGEPRAVVMNMNSYVFNLKNLIENKPTKKKRK